MEQAKALGATSKLEKLLTDKSFAQGPHAELGKRYMRKLAKFLTSSSGFGCPMQGHRDSKPQSGAGESFARASKAGRPADR